MTEYSLLGELTWVS